VRLRHVTHSRSFAGGSATGLSVAGCLRVGPWRAMPVSCSVIGRVTTTKIGFDVDLSGGDGGEMFKAGLKGIVLKKLNAPYRSGPSKT
jgi:hypothetical protein